MNELFSSLFSLFFGAVLFLRPYTLQRVVVQGSTNKPKDIEADAAEKIVEDDSAQQAVPGDADADADAAERLSDTKDDVRTAEGTLAEGQDGSNGAGDAPRKSIEKGDQ